MTNAILRGKPDAGNPHVRFDEGEVASYPPTVGRPEGVAMRGAKPRRGSLLYRKFLTGFLVTSVSVLMADDAIVYVDSSAVGNRDGSTWRDAYVSLRAAVDASPEGAEIRVASGTYYAPVDFRAEDARLESIVLKKRMAIKGGYPAGGGDARDPVAHPTVIDGDFAATASQRDNSETLLVMGEDSTIDGMVFRHAYQEVETNSALGIPVGRTCVTNCVFEENVGLVACFVNQEGNLHRFTKCEFLNNHGRNRGGVFRLKNKNVKFNVEDSLFRGNTATNGSCYFVGIDEGNGVNGLQQFIRCAFVSNVTVKTGGAVYAHYCKMPDFYDCLFTNNCASSGGALYMQGLYDQAWKAMVVSNCTFACNRSLSAAGGAVYGMQSGNYPYSFKDCRFVGNQSVANQHGGAVFIYNVGSAVFDGCSFTDNRAGLHGGAIGTTEYARIKLRDCDFSGNAATGNGGALFVNYGSSLKKDPYIATMTNCLFYGNQAQNGGAIYWARAAAGDYANLSVCGCRFVGNTAEGGNGGSVYFLGSSGNLSNGSFENCLFSGNSSASYGGAAHINGITTASFSSCTMAWNAAASGGTFALGDGVAPLANCIFHSGSASNGGREICAFSQSSSTIKSVGIIMHHVAFDSDPGEFVYGGDESMLSYNQEGMDDFVEKNVGQGMYYGKEDLVGDVVAGGRGDDAETWVMRSRLNSKAGYWAGSAWSKGSRNSKLIDAGPAEWPVGLEPTGHNGNRINMGFDAGTAYASWTKDPAFMLTLR